MRFQAHRGVNTEYPENTIIAYKAAKEQGYEIIELDPKVTSDGEFVLHHDRTVNRTGRQSDGSQIEKPTRVDELTLAELKTLDFGLFKDEKFAGTKIPTFAEMLDFIKGEKIINLYSRAAYLYCRLSPHSFLKWPKIFNTLTK